MGAICGEVDLGLDNDRHMASEDLVLAVEVQQAASHGAGEAGSVMGVGGYDCGWEEEDRPCLGGVEAEAEGDGLVGQGIGVGRSSLEVVAGLGGVLLCRDRWAAAVVAGVQHGKQITGQLMVQKMDQSQVDEAEHPASPRKLRRGGDVQVVLRVRNSLRLRVEWA